MLIDQFNLNQLRVFECVHRLRSMTAAARELHLTQSGVSQHIKALEDNLGLRLFDRIGQRLVPTPGGGDFYGECARILQELEDSLQRVKVGERALRGRLSIGMPIEFGNNLVAPLIARFGREHPRVRFQLRLGWASAMNELLLSGDMDFAFVDEYRMDRRIEVERVGEEQLELCIAAARWKEIRTEKPTRAFFEGLEYVDYQEGEPLLKRWFAHHMAIGGAGGTRWNVRATVMDVQGVARLVLGGMGAGVIPGHLVHQLEKGGARLHRFRGSGKPLKNTISIAFLRDRTHSPAAREAMRFLRAGLS